MEKKFLKSLEEDPVYDQENQQSRDKTAEKGDPGKSKKSVCELFPAGAVYQLVKEHPAEKRKRQGYANGRKQIVAIALANPLFFRQSVEQKHAQNDPCTNTQKIHGNRRAKKINIWKDTNPPCCKKEAARTAIPAAISI